MTDLVVLDYGSGNLASAERALRRTGASVTVTSDFDAALNCDGLVVPGVGAYEACMQGLTAVRGQRIIDRRGAARRWCERRSKCRSRSCMWRQQLSARRGLRSRGLSQRLRRWGRALFKPRGLLQVR